ncbi:MAG: SDR family oxidoreductase [Microscillaceae bacterium]
MLKEGALRDKTIVITGGGTGLGRSMTKYFLELGANVVITSRKFNILEQTANELVAETGGKVLPVACDVRHYEEVKHMQSLALETFGAVHAVVNNAAGNFISPTERLSPRAFDTIVDIVLRGSYNCTLAFGKDWIEKKQAGTFLNISVSYAWTGSGFTVPSACAKAGVLALTRSLAAEWGRYGIRSNAIAPGPFPTEGAWSRLFPEEALPKSLVEKLRPENAIPLGRVGEHQELANLAAYLVSDYSAYINGEVVTIDGGEWLLGAGEFNKMREVPDEMWDAIENQIRDANKKAKNPDN